jgi:dTDP-4-dehydrorhamnose 3,5-epimerase
MTVELSAATPAERIAASRPTPDGGATDAFAQRGPLMDLILFTPPSYRDARGFFRETWRADRYADAGIAHTFVQDNVSYSQRGVLRGLHFQEPNGQGKLVSAILGQVYDVALDVRVGSPTFGQWAGFHLSEENGCQLYLPPGYAHGFMVLSEVALFSYKCTDYYAPAAEAIIQWDDPDLGIEWPTEIAPIVSPRDRTGRRLSDFSASELPRWR